MSWKILVTDGRSLASLATIRSLGQRGHTIHCGESFSLNLSSYSKYVDEKILYPDPEESAKEFVHFLLSACEQEEYDLVLPVRDATTIQLSRHRSEFNQVTNIYVAKYENLAPLMDKGETIKIAQRAGVPTPKTWFPEETEIGRIKDEIEEGVDYPVLVRPRRSSGSRGIRHVTGPDDLDDAFDFVSEEYGMPIVQEYIEKSGYTTACLLFDEEQNVVGEFSYERIKEYPLSGGPTVVGVSTDDQEAKKHARELLTKADWMGPAEIEFILDQQGTPRLLEVNPRLWMPIQLAISSGVDFPSLIGELAAGRKPKMVGEYRTEVVYRWVLPNEILWLFNCDDKRRGIREFVSFDRENQCYGTLSISDPMPTIGTGIQSVRFLFDAEKRKVIFDRGWV